MNLYLRTHNIELPENILLEIDEASAKIKRFLPHLTDDQLPLSINIKPHRNIYRIKLMLVLPKDILVAKSRSNILGQAIKGGFNKLFDQITHYKQMRFKSLSNYPRKESIRWIEV